VTQLYGPCDRDGWLFPLRRRTRTQMRLDIPIVEWAATIGPFTAQLAERERLGRRFAEWER